MVPSFEVVHILELNRHIDVRHNLHSPILSYMAALICVSMKAFSCVNQMRACQTWILLAVFTSPTQCADVEDGREMVEKTTIISWCT
jgi:hypothetical protein